MSYFSPPEFPEKKYYIFGQGECKKFAAELNIPLLGKIPIVSAISDSGDNGSPVVMDEKSPVTTAFKELSEAVAQQIAISNSIREVFEGVKI
jgi:ATP-binding protein involved in chromosome partitioning